MKITNLLLPSAALRRSFATAAAVLLAGLSLPAAQANDITIQPGESTSKDSFVYSFLTGWAFDSASTGAGAAFGTWLSAGATTSGAHDLVSYLQFDLTDITTLGLTGSDINKAELYVYVESSSSIGFGANPSASYPIGVSAYEVTGSWTESTVTWATGPAYSTLAGSITINNVGYWTAIDITSTVQAWVDGTLTNYGVALEQDSPVASPGGQVVGVFHSSAGLNKPYLKVNY